MDRAIYIDIMAKGTRGRRGIASRQCRPKPYPFKPSHLKVKGLRTKRCSKLSKKDWEDATCSVCMEYPHNAVLLLCSSHEKGCRPYMCGTSFRYSNCLDQFKKAYAKVTSTSSENHHQHGSLDGSLLTRTSDCSDITELACPLCRGQVKGWTVVEPAREHLNGKKRSCMQENCAFTGSFKELRKHMKAEHPSAKPREVDPSLEQKWRLMEREREREDVMSTIRSSMPGAVFFGDYVIEGGQYDEFDTDDEEGFGEANGMNRENDGVEVGIDGNLMSVFLFLQAFGSNVGSDVGLRERDNRDFNRLMNRDRVRLNHGNGIDAYGYHSESSDDDNENGNDTTALIERFRRRRRPRRRREINEGQR